MTTETKKTETTFLEALTNMLGISLVLAALQQMKTEELKEYLSYLKNKGLYKNIITLVEKTIQERESKTTTAN